MQSRLNSSMVELLLTSFQLFPRVKTLFSDISNHWKKCLAMCLGLFLVGNVMATDYSHTIAVSSEYITNVMAQNGIPGVSIVLVESQQVVWAEGFGYANIEEQAPVTTNTVMMIGSVSKFLTAMMAMQVVDDGIFDLDACITNYVSDFAMLNRYEGAEAGWTIRTMLSHRSGIPGDIYNRSIATDAYWPEYTDWLMGYFRDDYPLYPPQTIASYCNSGFNIVGEAIARLDEVDFTIAGDNRVFTPLDMPYSSFLPSKATVSSNLAMGYSSDGTPAPDMVMNMPATGGAFSRPVDMANIIKMVLADGLFNGTRFLSTNALAAIGTDIPGTLDVDNFFKTGLGLDSVSDPVLSYAGRTWLKTGGTGKFTALLEILPDRQLGAFVNINVGSDYTFGIIHAILTNAVAEKDGIIPPAPTNMPNPAVTNWSLAELQAIEGYYITADGVDHFMAQADGSLSCVHNAESSTTVTTNYHPHVNGCFFVPGYQEQQLCFTNRAGYDIIVRFGNSGSERDSLMCGGYAEALYGTRYTPPAIPTAWSNRCETFWLATNLRYDDYFVTGQGELNGYTLSIGNGILQIQGSSLAVLCPANDSLAFVGGFSTRADSAVRITTNTAGHELLWFGGYLCMRFEDLPALTNHAVISGSVAANTNAFFTYADGTTGVVTRVRLSTNAADAVVRVFDMEQFVMTAIGTGSVEWTCSTQPVAIMVSSSNAIDFQISAYLRNSSRSDFDGDGKADPALYVESTGNWYVKLSSSGYGLVTINFGGSGCSICVGDYDGDGKADPAVYQMSTGNWYVKLSASGYGVATMTGFGGTGYESVVGDYDGDGKADPAIYNTSSGDWQVAMSSMGYGMASVSGLGGTGYTAIQENYDSDNRTDAAVYNTASGNWTILLSANNYITDTLWGFGGADYAPVQGDFDGDGLADPAIYQESTGNWQVKLSGSQYATATLEGFGGSGTQVAAADYDGDGKADPIYLDTATGEWHVKLSASGYGAASISSGYSP